MDKQTWKVLLHGDIYDKNGYSYEVSVVDTNNREQISRGWYDENKIPITSSELVNCQLNPRSPERIERALKIAQVLCDALNTIDLDEVSLRSELRPTQEQSDEKV